MPSCATSLRLTEVPELLETSEIPATPGWKRTSTPYLDENAGGYSEKFRTLISLFIARLPASRLFFSLLRASLCILFL